MMRRTIALAAALWLGACSGQRNADTKSLNSNRGDAGKDAAPSEDADNVDDPPDAEEPEEDAAEKSDAAPEASDAGGGPLDAGASDAGSSASDADSSTSDADSSTSDGGSTDTGTGADTGPGDAGSDAGEDAALGDAGAQLRIRVLNYVESPFGATPVVFSYADGGVESVRELDTDGRLVSDTAPAMVTVLVPNPQIGSGDTYLDIVSVLSPQLGDELVFGPARTLPGNETDPPPKRYSIVLDNLPTGSSSLYAYAGVDGCADGYLDYGATPSTPLAIYQPTDCELENPGSALVLVRSTSEPLLRVGLAALPAAAASPVNLALFEWAVPEDLLITTANVPSNVQPEVDVWLRKQRLRVLVDRPYSPSQNQFPFRVARSLVDSYDVAMATADSSIRTQYFFRKNRPASVTSVAFDVAAEALPAVDPANRTFALEPLLRPSASWSVNGGSTPADAMSALFSWSYRPPSSDFGTHVGWRIVAPPETTRVQVPALPTTGVFELGLIPAESDVWFDALEYYDSDTENGYREFLKEPLRVSTDSITSDGIFSGVLERELREGGTLRIVRSNNPQD